MHEHWPKGLIKFREVCVQGLSGWACKSYSRIPSGPMPNALRRVSYDRPNGLVEQETCEKLESRNNYTVRWGFIREIRTDDATLGKRLFSQVAASDILRFGSSVASTPRISKAVWQRILSTDMLTAIIRLFVNKKKARTVVCH
jgi:hypothetical protein